MGASKDSINEQVAVFGASHRLVGVVTEPIDRAAGEPHLGVILLNSGLIHRVGPRRLSVRLARTLSQRGLVALRFDLSGHGDSEPPRDNVSVVDAVIRDTREAMSHLERCYGVEKFLLMGICSGAIISFATALRDPRVVRAALIDPQDFGSSQLESPTAQESTFVRHYWRSVRSKPFTGQRWVRLLTGKAKYRYFLKAAGLQIRGLFSRRGEPRQAGEHLAAQFEDLGTRVVLVHPANTEKGTSLDYFELTLAGHLDRLRRTVRIEFEVIPGADHDFSLLESQDSLVQIVTDWAESASE